MDVTDLVTPIAAANRDEAEFGVDESALDGDLNFLGDLVKTAKRPEYRELLIFSFATDATKRALGAACAAFVRSHGHKSNAKQIELCV